VIEQMVTAWRFIFDHHPDGETIMQEVIDSDRIITVNQFKLWFNEARSN
jgi:hypothetical protein